MSSKIHRLSEQTINQIAAGEVIENPASVVKELIENAVDAQARSIVIEITGGGYQLIRIADDGCGMNPTDARQCLERHATSKITSAADLAQLMTLGFRGEALASIASISKMRLITAEEHLIGTQIDVEGGTPLSTIPASRPRGTTFEVQSLFYNVPARKKFQKSASASTSEITKVTMQQALAHPEISIDLILQDQLALSIRGSAFNTTAIAQRSQELLGDSFSSEILPLDLEQKDWHLRGIVVSPLVHRHNRTGQYLFINRRPIQAPAIAHAIKEAFGSRLPADRYPLFVLHIDIDPGLVDVNVHPQKKEVRFRDETELRGQLRRALSQNLDAPLANVAPSAPLFSALASSFPTPPWECQEAPLMPLPSDLSPQPKPNHEKNLIDILPSVGLWNQYLLMDAAALRELNYPIGFCQWIPSTEGLVFIDLAAASMRITYDQWIKRATSSPVSQSLLIPEVLNVSIEETALLLSNEIPLQKLGFHLRLCGKCSFLVESIPPFIESDQALPLVQELMTALKEPFSEEQIEKLVQASSHFASGRKKAFMLQEAEEIFKQLLQTSSPYFCPRGRLIMTFMSIHDLEKKFQSLKGAIAPFTEKAD